MFKNGNLIDSSEFLAKASRKTERHLSCCFLCARSIFGFNWCKLGKLSGPMIQLPKFDHRQSDLRCLPSIRKSPSAFPGSSVRLLPSLFASVRDADFASISRIAVCSSHSSVYHRLSRPTVCHTAVCRCIVNLLEFDCFFGKFSTTTTENKIDGTTYNFEAVFNEDRFWKLASCSQFRSEEILFELLKGAFSKTFSISIGSQPSSESSVLTALLLEREREREREREKNEWKTGMD